jgi:hypothetical protein
MQAVGQRDENEEDQDEDAADQSGMQQDQQQSQMEVPEHVSLKTLVDQFQVPTPFSMFGLNTKMQEDLVQSRMTRDENLKQAILTGLLLPLVHPNDGLSLLPEQESKIYVVYNPFAVVVQPDEYEDSGIPQVVHERVRIRLEGVEAPPRSADSSLDSSVRELSFRAKVSQSILSIAQKNINFGHVLISECHSKTVRIRNHSSTPLLYNITKTGSFASGFLGITEGRQGVIKPFGSSEVKFEFQPSLPGKFEETLEVVNVQNPTNAVKITIKCKVLKPETFEVIQAPQELDFGSCCVNERSRQHKIPIRNISKKRRKFAIRSDQSAFSVHGWAPIFEMSLDSSSSDGGKMSQGRLEMEEELERLEHKLRIAETKQRKEKISKYAGKIAKLKAAMETNSEEDIQLDSQSESESDSELLHSALAATSRSRNRENLFAFNLEAESVGHIVVSVIFRHHDPIQSAEARDDVPGTIGDENPLETTQGHGIFTIYEVINKDLMKEVSYSATVFGDPEAYCQAVGRPWIPPATNKYSTHPSKPGMIKSSENALPAMESVTRVEFASFSQEDADLQLVDAQAAGVVADPLDSHSHAFHIEVPTLNSAETQVQKHADPVVPFSLKFSVESDSNLPEASTAILIHSSSTDNHIFDISWSQPKLDALCPSDLAFEFEIATNIFESHGENSSNSITPQMPRSPSSDFQSYAASLRSSCHVDSKRSVSRVTMGILPVRICLKKGTRSIVKLRWMQTSTSNVRTLKSDVLGNICVTPVLTPQASRQLSILMSPGPESAISLVGTDVNIGQHLLGTIVPSEIIICNSSHEPKRCVFILPGAPRANGDESSAEAVAKSGLTLEQSIADIPPFCRFKMPFVYTATVPGHHAIGVIVKTLGVISEQTTLTVSVVVSSPLCFHPLFVQFPELDPAGSGKLEELNLGHCFVTPRDAFILKELTVKNMQEQVVLLSARSNLKKQCYVYVDPEHQHAVDFIPLQPFEIKTVFVVIRPHLAPEASRTGHCRELVGGIRVTVHSPGSLQESPDGESLYSKDALLSEFSIIFKGIVGVSILRVSPPLVNFGSRCQKDIQVEHNRVLKLTNGSKSLPLEFEIQGLPETAGSLGDNMTLAVKQQMPSMSLTLSTSKGVLSAQASEDIQLNVTPHACGLLHRRMHVVNLSCAGQQRTIDALLFVDESILDVSIPRLQDSEAAVDSKDVLQLGEVCLKPDASCVSFTPLPYIFHAESVSSAPPRVFWSLMLKNLSSNPINVQPLSNLPVHVLWEHRGDADNADDVKTFGDQVEDWLDAGLEHAATKCGEAKLCLPSQLRCCGNPHTLAANSSVQVVVTVQEAAVPASCKSAQNIEKLMQGKKVSFEGLVAFRRTLDAEEGATVEQETTRISKVVNLVGEWCVPQLTVDLAEINLGKIGYMTHWKPTRFSVTVMNRSEVGVTFRLNDLPPEIVVVRPGTGVEGDDSEAAVEGLCWWIPPEASYQLLLELRLNAKESTAGTDQERTEQYQINLVNCGIPDNVLAVHVRAQVVTTPLVFVFPDSPGSQMVHSDSAHLHVNSLILPAVIIPPPLEAHAFHCNAWFTVSNHCGDEVVHFDVVFEPAPALSDVLEMELLSRSANTPWLATRLLPSKQVDIRVVCHVKQGGRLTPDILAAAAEGSRDHASESASHKSGGDSVVVLGWLNLKIGPEPSMKSEQELFLVERVAVKGVLQSGTTFSLSTSALHFYAAKSARVASANSSRSLQEDANEEDVNENELKEEEVDKNADEIDVQEEVQEDDEDVIVEEEPAAPLDAHPTVSNSGRVQQELMLRNHQDTFWIKNLSPSEPLRFRISSTAKRYKALRLLLRDSAATARSRTTLTDCIAAKPLPESGEVPPNSMVEIHVQLRPAPHSHSHMDSSDRLRTIGNPHDDDDSAPMTLVIEDCDALQSAESGPKATVDVRLVVSDQDLEQSSARIPELPSQNRFKPPRALTPMADPKSQGSAAESSQLPTMGLRGCTPIERSEVRFEVNIGQQDMDAHCRFHWEITIGSLNSDCKKELDYRLSLVGGGYQNNEHQPTWVTLGRDHGTIEQARDFHNIMLYFSRAEMGVYSAYLLVENLSNLNDFKLVRIGMEVITSMKSLRQLSRANRLQAESEDADLFLIMVAGAQNRSSGLEIDYGELTLDQLYHVRSFILVNRANIPLAFMLSTPCETQVKFSLSTTSLKECNVVSVEAHSELRVYIHFTPTLTAEEELLSAGTQVFERECELNVKCRLVKDYERAIFLRAKCRRKQLQVEDRSQSESSKGFIGGHGTSLSLLFIARDDCELAIGSPSARRLQPVPGSPLSRQVIVTNQSDSAVIAAIRNDSLFFKVEVIQEEAALPIHVHLGPPACSSRTTSLGASGVVLISCPAGSSVVLQVQPDLDALCANEDNFQSNVEEHFSVYNMGTSEQCKVALRFTCSKLRNFYQLPGANNAHPFSKLEGIVAKFLQQYILLWNQLDQLAGVLPESFLEYQSGESAHTRTASRFPGAFRRSRQSDMAKSKSFPALMRVLALKACLSIKPVSSDTILDAIHNMDQQGPSSFESQAQTLSEEQKAMMTDIARNHAFLFFDFYCITDQLVFYAVKGHIGRFAVRLANLMYSVVYRHQVFREFWDERVPLPAVLVKWTKQLEHFLAFFPNPSQELTALLHLNAELHSSRQQER